MFDGTCSSFSFSLLLRCQILFVNAQESLGLSRDLMKSTTPTRSVAGVSPIAPTPTASPVPTMFHSSLRYGGGGANSAHRMTPIQSIPMKGSSNTVDISFSADEANAAPPVAHIDTIIPLNLDFSERLLNGAAAQAGSGGGPSVSNIHLTKDQLLQLQVETTEYVDNLDLTLKTLFANDNSRLRQTIVNTSDIPLTFMFLRLQQQMLKLSGDFSAQRERQTLQRLAQLLDA